MAKAFLLGGWLSDRKAVDAKVDHPKPPQTMRNLTTNTATESVLTARRKRHMTRAMARGDTQ